MKKSKKWLIAILLSVVAFSLAACSESAEDDEDHGDLVPPVVIYSSLPESNMVNYEMAQEVAVELRSLGVDATAQPVDFAVLLDILYGEDMDYDAYTIGWSGRVERLDPDMFIRSINHSDFAEAGGNNTNRYVNPELDALADEQSQELDLDTRQQIVNNAQMILAEDVPHVTLYSRANVQTFNEELWDADTLYNIPGEGLFNEWTPLTVEPLTDQSVLRVASNVNIDEINPLTSISVYGWRNLRMIYDKLVRLSPDIEPIPWAATSWEVVDDTTIDVELREDMTFHDGMPVRPEDVKYSYELFIDLEVGYFASFLGPVDSIELTGGQTIRFNLEEAYAPFITNTLAQIPILPEHVWSEIDDPLQYQNEEAIGSGPFKLDSFVTGEELVVSRFDDYFEPAKIDGYIFQIFASPDGVISALEREDVDMVSFDLIPAHIDLISSNDSGAYDHLMVTEAQDIGFFYLGFNLNRSPFDIKDFRVAVAYLTDYDYALDDLLGGYGSRGGGGLTIVEGNEFWHNPDVPIHDTYDPARAKEILEEAGFTWDSQDRLRLPEEE